MKHGWISLHRKLQDSEIWHKEPFSRGQAWVDLLLLANYKEGFVIKNDKVIEIKRGQVGHSILDLSIRWKWSRTKVNTFLNLLQNLNQISIETRQRITSIISITNYDKYQDEKQREDNEKTTRRQREDINNKDNNVNKKKQLKELYSESVSFTKDEYEKLKTKFKTEERLKEGIEILNNYKMATGKKYKSDYHAMLNWVIERVNKDGRQRDCDPDVKDFFRGMGEEDNPRDN